MRRVLKTPLPRHWTFFLTLPLGILAGLVSIVLAPQMAIQLGTDTFFVAYLLLMLVQAPKLDEAYLRAHAAEEDAPARTIFVVTIGLIAVSAVSLFSLLNGPDVPHWEQLVLSIASIGLGFLAIHVMWAMHYAYEYYDVAEVSPGGKKAKPGAIIGGLDFPGEEQPDGWAFLYFSFVLGMTAQTSDVNITSNQMRRIVFWHSLFSFMFNTVIVAATVNVVVSVGQ